MTAETERTSTVEVAGRTVRVASLGTGEPVVALHGLGGYLEEWAESQAALAEHFAVHAPDLPGFGLSAPLDHPDLPGIAHHVLAALDALGIAEPVHLVGNSLGGAIAMQVAVEAPRRVATAVLADSAGFGRQVNPGLRLLGVPGLGRALLRVPGERRARMQLRAQFHDPAFATEARIALKAAHSRRDGAAEAFLAVAHQLGSWRGVRHRWRQRLVREFAQLRIPTLLLWGTHDRILPATQLVAAARALPHARTHLFPETGHMPHVERAAEFTALVREFITTHPQSVHIGAS
jgi:pimeloyl-ACP methyl ester carboxylesterase